MPAGPAPTWELLASIETVAMCMPGAKITEQVDATHFKGTVTVKLGPATLTFRGDLEVRELDAANRTLVLAARGTDTTGSSAATLDLRAVVRASADGASTLTGTCDAAINGRAATFAGRMMDTVAEQILGQFAAEFCRAALGAGPTGTGRAPGGFQEPGRFREPGTGAGRRAAERRSAPVGGRQELAARAVHEEGCVSRGAQRLADVTALQQQLANAGYIAERSFAAALLLMVELKRPLLLEGDAGVGKTEVAKALAAARGTRLIRLQCYEGLDAHSAMYEWNYQRQLLAIKLLEQDERSVAAKEQDIFSERYLLRRPLLEAISCATAPVLLIDEVDRADEAFEAYLLELLSDFQMSIPELGTITALTVPLVVVTSNGTRELSDALRRRCLYQFVDYPSFEKELAILELRAPEAVGLLARQVVQFVQDTRRMDLQKRPGVAETLDWTAALLRLGVTALGQDSSEAILETLAALIKTREDRTAFTRDVVERMAAAC